MGLVAPLGELVQFAGDRLHVSCNTNPGVAGAQAMVALSGEAGAIVSTDAPVTCTACGKAQKPAVIEYCSLVIGPPASDWPMVQLSEYEPPALVPPPPAILDQSMK